MKFSLSPGQAGDAPEGRRLLTEIGAISEPYAMIMDKAYKGDETRKLVSELGFSPAVPPESSRTEPWEHDKELYKKYNEVEWLIRRLKGFRRIFTRFDIMFMGFIFLALILIAIR